MTTEGEAVDVDVDEEDEEDEEGNNVVSSPPCTSIGSEEEDSVDPTSPEEEAAETGTAPTSPAGGVSREASGCFAALFLDGDGGEHATINGNQNNAATTTTRRMARAMA